MHLLVLLLSLSSSPSSSSSSSSDSPLEFYEIPPNSFHRITIDDRPLYLDPSASSIPCGYRAPTELDIFRYAALQDPKQGIAMATPQKFHPNKCSIMIVRLLFGASGIFSSRTRKYLKLSDHHHHRETLCYLVITDSLSLQNPLIAESLIPNRTSSRSPSQSLHWHVFALKNPIYSNPAKTMAAIKLSLFRLFPLARFILYYDLSYQMKGDPLKFLALCYKLMREANTAHAIYSNDAVTSSKTMRSQFIEAKDRLQSQQKKNPYVTEELSDIERQQEQYEREGFFDIVSGSNTLPVDPAILVFKNNEPDLHRFFCAWMNEAILYSSEDELSYKYVEHKLNITGLKIPEVFLSKYFENLSPTIPNQPPTIPIIDKQKEKERNNKKKPKGIWKWIF